MLSRRMLMEDYLLRNKGVFLVPVFKVASWENTFEKDIGDFPEAEVLTFKKNAKSIFNRDNSTLCPFMRRILRMFLKRDVTKSSLNKPGLWTLAISPSSRMSKAYLAAEESHVRPEIGRDCRSNLKGSTKEA
ncbi:putative serine/threonine-protein kinase [Sesbania bispinosa]|nr:putative serine/threonine-protein kinase [Sesbania bispinosa]